MQSSNEMDGNPSCSVPSFSEMIRKLWPKHTRKLIAGAADVTERRAKDWVEGLSHPPADKLLLMAARNEEVRRELIDLLGKMHIAEQQAKTAILDRKRSEARRARLGQAALSGNVAARAGGQDRSTWLGDDDHLAFGAG